MTVKELIKKLETLKLADNYEIIIVQTPLKEEKIRFVVSHKEEFVLLQYKND